MSMIFGGGAGSISAGDLPTGIDAAKIGGGTVSDMEFATLDGVSSSIQNQLNNKQAAAAILGALATLGYGTAGQILKTNSGADGLEWDDEGGVSAPLYLAGLLQLQNGAENADLSVDSEGNLLIAPQNYQDYVKVESFFSLYYHYYRIYSSGDFWAFRNMLANRGWYFLDPSDSIILELGYGTAAKADLRVPLRLNYSAAPASSSASGVASTVAWDDSYLYLCTATDTWKRAALSTW